MIDRNDIEPVSTEIMYVLLAIVINLILIIGGVIAAASLAVAAIVVGIFGLIGVLIYVLMK